MYRSHKSGGSRMCPSASIAPAWLRRRVVIIAWLSSSSAGCRSLTASSWYQTGMNARLPRNLAAEHLNSPLRILQREVVRVHPRHWHATGFDQPNRRDVRLRGHSEGALDG